MLLVRTSLRPSKIHGIGVFTEEPIKKGQLVWEFDPRVDIRIPLEERENFPPAMREYLRRLAYVERVDGKLMMVLCADNGKFVNHSSEPNLIDTPDLLGEIAARDIPAGEELTCDYYVSDLRAAEKFEPPGLDD